MLATAVCSAAGVAVPGAIPNTPSSAWTPMLASGPPNRPAIVGATVARAGMILLKSMCCLHRHLEQPLDPAAAELVEVAGAGVSQGALCHEQGGRLRRVGEGEGCLRADTEDAVQRQP